MAASRFQSHAQSRVPESHLQVVRESFGTHQRVLVRFFARDLHFCEFLEHEETHDAHGTMVRRPTVYDALISVLDIFNDPLCSVNS